MPTLIIISIFTACEKEDIKNTPIDKVNPVEFNEKDYEAYIKELIESTGIDVYELSKFEEIKKVAIEPLHIMNAAVSETSQTKGALTQEKLLELQNLERKMKAAAAIGDDYEVLKLFEILCSICRTIDGFVFDENEYGLETFIYEPGKDPLQLPMSCMESAMANALALNEKITINYPQYPSLSEAIQTKIIAAAVSINIFRSITATKTYSVTDCKKDALADYGIALAGAHAGLTIALHGCAAAALGTAGTATGPCVAPAFAGYGVAVGFATWGYKRAVKRCG